MDKRNILRYKTEIVIFLIFLIYTFLLYNFLIKSNFLLWGNDLTANTSYFTYIKDSLIKHHTIPLWNFFYGAGLPIAGDPLNGFYNPLVLISFIVFPFLTAIKAIYFLSILFSCITMYLLSRFLKIEKIISVFLSLTYASSGYILSRMIAGHLEKILAYPLIPITIISLILFYKKPNVLYSGIIALLISLLIFSGSIYEAFYSIIIFL